MANMIQNIPQHEHMVNQVKYASTYPEMLWDRRNGCVFVPFLVGDALMLRLGAVVVVVLVGVVVSVVWVVMVSERKSLVVSGVAVGERGLLESLERTLLKLILLLLLLLLLLPAVPCAIDSDALI
jgi:hypothetical protein